MPTRPRQYNWNVALSYPVSIVLDSVMLPWFLVSCEKFSAVREGPSGLKKICTGCKKPLGRGFPAFHVVGTKYDIPAFLTQGRSDLPARKSLSYFFYESAAQNCYSSASKVSYDWPHQKRPLSYWQKRPEQFSQSDLKFSYCQSDLINEPINELLERFFLR